MGQPSPPDHDHDPRQEHSGHSHAHGHSHPQGHNHAHAAGFALGVSLILNAVFLVIELGAGFWTGSLALLSDAAHMLSDVAALSLAFFAARLARRPPTAFGTFGFKRAEVLGAFVNAGGLVLACVFIFTEAWERLSTTAPPLPGVPMLVVAVAGLAINIGSAWFLHRSGANDLNVRAALAHMIADALGSVGAVVAALAVLFFDFYAADAIASLIIGALVLWGAYGLLKESARVLLEFAPPGLDQDVLSSALLEIDGVAQVHELHVWMLGGPEAIVTAHLVPEEDASPYDVLEAAERVLRERYRIEHSTLQVDPCDGPPCRQVRCPMLPEAV